MALERLFRVAGSATARRAIPPGRPLPDRVPNTLSTLGRNVCPAEMLAPLQLALAALGACLSRSKDWYAIWTDTNRLLVTSIAVHKSQFQSQMIFLAWILHETAAIMGDSPGVVRPVTMAHAFIGGAMRRSWRWQRLPADQRQMSSTSGPLLLLTLQNDLLRSIYFNSDLDVVALFGHRNLTPFTDDTLDDFEAEVFDSHFLDISSQGPELSLLTLLLIWNQILVQCSIACCGRGGSKCETSKTSVLMLTMDQEIRLARHRASRALSNWSSSHYEEASMELRALYHFCAMSLTLPSLRMLYLPFGSSSSTLKGAKAAFRMCSRMPPSSRLLWTPTAQKDQSLARWHQFRFLKRRSVIVGLSSIASRRYQPTVRLWPLHFSQLLCSPPLYASGSILSLAMALGRRAVSRS